MAEIKLTPEQQRVVDTRNCNLLVAAAAGSGKTAVLVKRIIKKVTEEGQDIDRLLIVTFTNAAAAEMRERIGAAIEEALTQNPDSAHLQRQMLLLHNAQITTIHSFCLSVIREFFHLLSLDPGFRIGDEAELSLLRSDVLEEVLEACYEKEEDSFVSFVESFGSLKNDTAVKDYVLKLYETAMSQPYPEEWLDSLAEGFSFSEEAFRNHPMFDRVMQEVRNCLADCNAILGRLLTLSKEPEGPTAYEETFRLDEALLQELSLAAKEYTTFAEVLENLKFATLSRKKQEASEEKKELAKALRKTIKDRIQKLQKDFFYESLEELRQSMAHMERPMQGLVSITREFMSRYEAQKTEKNLLDFNDLEHMALRILTERDGDGAVQPTTAAKTLSARFDEIMIDEYQDSNLIQEAVLNSVSGAWRGEPNVFMVGDVKQSIYRFRMACPDLFMEKYETYGDEGKAQKIDLAKNFRSRKCVLDSINVLFAGLMHKDSTEVEYDAAAALYFGASYPEEQPYHHTEVLFVETEETQGDNDAGNGLDENAVLMSEKSNVEKASTASEKNQGNYPDEISWEENEATSKSAENGELNQEEKTLVQAEALAVVKRIRELKNSNFTVGSDSRPVEYGDIVILLRTMSGWSEAFLEVLSEQGIPAYADTSAGYFKTFEIKKTLEFLRILDNPKQDIPFAAVLHSPIGGFNAQELAELKVKYGVVSAENKTNRCLYAAARKAAEAAVQNKIETVEEKSARFFTLYDRLRNEADYVSIHELIQNFYRYSGFRDVVTVMPGGERRRGNLDMLVAKAKQYEATSFSGLYDFIRYIDRLIKYEVDFGEAGGGAAGQMVRIMSIHKSKGLEFPVVFLCGMEKKMNRMDMRSRLIIHSKLGLGPEFVDTTLRVKSPTLLKKVIARQMNDEMIAEELRVLYVAMTRAREKLILVGAVKDSEKRQAVWQERAETVDEQGMLSSYVLNANTYYDFVCPLLFAGVGEELFDLRTYGSAEQEEEKESRKKTKEELLAVLAKLKLLGAEATDTEAPDLKVAGASKETKEIRALLQLQEHFVYPYGIEANLPVKVTVSELKRLHLEEEEQEQQDTAVVELVPSTENHFAEAESESTEPEEDCTYPEFLQPEKKLSGSDRGTIYHHVMELFPFEADISREKVKAVLDAMVQEGRLLKEQRNAVNDDKLVKFFASELGRKMCRAAKAGTLHREQPFVMGFPAKEVYPDSNSEEMILVQGVIDAFFEEEDGLVLMDYKTDYIHEDARTELTKKYQNQLAYYRTALQKLTGKPVKEVWFYAFAKNEGFQIE